MRAGVILLAAGGTGGHLFPAEALAHELITRGYQIHLATDDRARRYLAEFPASETHIVRSATFGSKNPVAILKTMQQLFNGYRRARALLKAIRPTCVVGFGGYPTLPPVLAAQRKGIPSLIHEQNAILGRANRLLARRSKGVAVGFRQVGEAPQCPVIETGNPVRPIVLEAAATAYPTRKADGPFRTVVFGGSQGARFFSEIMPKALAGLPEDRRARLDIVQQARQEDETELRRQFGLLGLEAAVSPFFANMPEQIAKSHLVIARAGASTVTECAVIGRPAILVPLPGSLDGDQAANAIAMSDAGGAFVVPQAELTPQKLAEMIETAMAGPGELVAMAQKARTTGIADAASRLADCVERVISGGDLSALNWS